MPVGAAAASLSEALARPPTLEIRLHTIRKQRMASRRTTATRLAAWIAVLAAFTAVAIGGLVTIR